MASPPPKYRFIQLPPNIRLSRGWTTLGITEQTKAGASSPGRTGRGPGEGRRQRARTHGGGWGVGDALIGPLTCGHTSSYKTPSGRAGAQPALSPCCSHRWCAGWRRLFMATFRWPDCVCVLVPSDRGVSLDSGKRLYAECPCGFLSQRWPAQTDAQSTCPATFLHGLSRYMWVPRAALGRKEAHNSPFPCISLQVVFLTLTKPLSDLPHCLQPHFSRFSSSRPCEFIPPS